MILWCDGAHSAAENMRRDAALLERLERGEDPRPVLRLFCFAPPGITLGLLQDPDRQLDTARCRADGIEWAVRPTGGRAIFHAEEWTYAFAGRLDDPRWGGTLGESYAAVGELLLKSLVRLGVPAELASGRGTVTERAGGSATAPCFASTARHEILLEGRKLVGSAQRRLRRAFLQEGSVLLGDGHLRLADYLCVPEESRARIRADLARRSSHAGRWMGRAALERWADALVAELREPAEVLRGETGREALTPCESASYTRSSLALTFASERSRT